MDLFLYLFNNAISFAVASVPLMLVFLLIKVFKLPHKIILSCLLSCLVISVFFWTKLSDIGVALYQGVPYLSSFMWVWADRIWCNMNQNNKY